jgi:hypothetical protein
MKLKVPLVRQSEIKNILDAILVGGFFENGYRNN